MTETPSYSPMLIEIGYSPNLHFLPKPSNSDAYPPPSHLRLAAIYFEAGSVWEMRMQVFKWGRHLAVRLPDDLVMELELRDGDEIEVLAIEKLAPGVRKAVTLRELIAGVRKYRGRLPAEFRFSREQAHERGQ